MYFQCVFYLLCILNVLYILHALCINIYLVYFVLSVPSPAVSLAGTLQGAAQVSMAGTPSQAVRINPMMVTLDPRQSALAVPALAHYTQIGAEGRSLSWQPSPFSTQFVDQLSQTV